MPKFEVVNNFDEISLSNEWVESTKFNGRNKLVDPQGRYVDETYAGRKYQLIVKKERSFHYLERVGHIFLGVLAVVGSLGITLFSHSVRELFIKQKENMRFAVLVPSSLPVSTTTAPRKRRKKPFELLPEVRKAIVEDTHYLLNNSSLMTLLKEHGLEGNEEALTACYDLAFFHNHPYIYRLSERAVLASEYSLNFLWVNLNPQDRVQNLAQNIFKEGVDLSENAECIKDPHALRILEGTDLESWEGVKKSFTYKISKWADVHPNAQINLWYDSALVTQQAKEKTLEMMGAISQSRGVFIQLRDIRRLSTVKGEIENSLHPGTPVYYRVDLLKALIADHIITSPEESAKYCVVSDIDIEPMSPQQLFDQRTVDYLSSRGYVFKRVGFLGFENSFYIFNRERERLAEVHRQYVLEQTARNLTNRRSDSRNADFRMEYIINAQFVHDRYVHFLEQMKALHQEGPNDPGPRKVVRCPPSQFNGGGLFLQSDHRSETFRFIGESNLPYTRYGRSGGDEEKPIDALVNWQAEPLF